MDFEIHDNDGIVTKVLLANIVNVLQRMETWMEGQEKRLSTMEASIDASGVDRFIDKPLPDPPEDHSTAGSEDIGNPYPDILLKSKTKYVFEDSLSDLGDGDKNPAPLDVSEDNCPPKSDADCLHADHQNEDACSVSVYSNNLLESRAAHVPRDSGTQADASQRNDIPTVPYETTLEATGDISMTAEKSSRSSLEGSWKTAPNGSSVRSKRPNEIAELIFYAFENWKRGVLSKMKVEERMRQKEPLKSLKEVAKPQASKFLSTVGRWLKSKASAIHASQNVFVY